MSVTSEFQQTVQTDQARIVNPQASTLVGLDSHLPAILAEHLNIESIASALKLASSVEPATRGDGHKFAGASLRSAAVLMGLVVRNSGLHMVLTERASHLRKHAGQIAFPGGAIDATDASAWAAAQREAMEEIGTPSHALSYLGQLPTYTTVTAFEVVPCVASLDSAHAYQPAPAEVAAVFELALVRLMNPASHQRRTIDTPVGERTFYAIPTEDSQGIVRFVWGATAGMIRNLYTVLHAYQLEKSSSQ